MAPLSAERRTSFTAAEQVIDASKSYRAVLKTSKGDVVVRLDAGAAPLAVNNFVFLALNRFYDGTRFHRVIEGFMAQGGDPQSADLAQKDAWGTGGPGYSFANERSSLTFNRAGVLAMANAGPDTNGSQFFITFGPTEFLNGGYTIFGQVESGMDTVNGLTRNYDNAGPIAGTEADVLNSVEIQVK
ncbi:peptidylprolyl isomerase [Deinococcus wulumuqiensis R12]|nr:peptidylprolyl isomerase [Deinococcus wulumuqiensis R12]